MLWWFNSNGAIASDTHVQMAAKVLVIAKIPMEPNVPLDIFKTTVSLKKMYNNNTFHLASLKQQWVREKNVKRTTDIFGAL